MNEMPPCPISDREMWDILEDEAFTSGCATRPTFDPEPSNVLVDLLNLDLTIRFGPFPV